MQIRHWNSFAENLWWFMITYRKISERFSMYSLSQLSPSTSIFSTRSSALPTPPLPSPLLPFLHHILCSYGTEPFTPLFHNSVLVILYFLLGKASLLFLIWTTSTHLSRPMWNVAWIEYANSPNKVTHFPPSASMKNYPFLYSCIFSYYAFMWWFLLNYFWSMWWV